ncbi:hypothetical protein IAU59_007610 [Kwoniella sp. CBS 9459]
MMAWVLEKFSIAEMKGKAETRLRPTATVSFPSHERSLLMPESVLCSPLACLSSIPSGHRDDSNVRSESISSAERSKTGGTVYAGEVDTLVLPEFAFQSLRTSIEPGLNHCHEENTYSKQPQVKTLPPSESVMLSRASLHTTQSVPTCLHPREQRKSRRSAPNLLGPPSLWKHLRSKPTTDVRRPSGLLPS